MGKKRSRRLAGVLAALLLVVSTGACSGSDDADDSVDEGSGATSSPSVVTLTSSAGKVTGKLPRKTRERVVAKVARRVDEWFTAGWLGGDYPRTSMAHSWPGFTAGLAAQARRDKADTTNARLAPRIDGVTAVRKRVKVDILAVDGKAVGATARFRLVFDTEGKVERRVQVLGELSLTQGKRGWKVFGYDVRRSVGAGHEKGAGHDKDADRKKEKK